jgi:hypothetical protein
MYPPMYAPPSAPAIQESVHEEEVFDKATGKKITATVVRRKIHARPGPGYRRMLWNYFILLVVLWITQSHIDYQFYRGSQGLLEDLYANFTGFALFYKALSGIATVHFLWLLSFGLTWCWKHWNGTAMAISLKETAIYLAVNSPFYQANFYVETKQEEEVVQEIIEEVPRPRRREKQAPVKEERTKQESGDFDFYDPSAPAQEPEVATTREG